MDSSVTIPFVLRRLKPESVLNDCFPGAKRLSIIIPESGIVPKEENVPIPPSEQQDSPSSASSDSLLSSADSRNNNLSLQSPRSPTSKNRISRIADQANPEESMQTWNLDARIVPPDLVRRTDGKPRTSSLSRSWLRPKSEAQPMMRNYSIAELLPHDFEPAKKEHGIKIARLWRRWKLLYGRL